MDRQTKNEALGKYVYTILQITDPDYGCEETHRAEPTALLKLREEPSDDVRYVEVPERVLVEQGLSTKMISAVDEKKHKKLWAITPEEYEMKKKQLLGL